MIAYLSVLVFLLLSLTAATVLLALGIIVSPSDPSRDKLASFECGFPPIGQARVAFDIRFYLVAIVFLIFDLETAFLFPWAVVFRDSGALAVGSMMIFLGVLTLGFLYEWRKGALNWE